MESAKSYDYDKSESASEDDSEFGSVSEDEVLDDDDDLVQLDQDIEEYGAEPESDDEDKDIPKEYYDEPEGDDPEVILEEYDPDKDDEKAHRGRGSNNELRGFYS